MSQPENQCRFDKIHNTRRNAFFAILCSGKILVRMTKGGIWQANSMALRMVSMVMQKLGKKLKSAGPCNFFNYFLYKQITIK